MMKNSLCDKYKNTHTCGLSVTVLTITIIRMTIVKIRELRDTCKGENINSVSKLLKGCPFSSIMYLFFLNRIMNKQVKF